MKKKICILTNNYYHLENFLLPFINSKSIKYDITIILSKVNKVELQLNNNIIIKHLNFKRNYNIFSHFINLIKIIFIFKRNNYDVIHTHTPIVSIISRIAAIFSKTKIIYYTCHGFYFHEYSNKFNYFIWYLLEKILSKITTRIFYVSKEDYNFSKINNFKTKKKSIYIGNGVNLEKFKYRDNSFKLKVKNDLKINRDDFAVVFIGRIVEEKGILDLINSLKLINIDIREKIKLYLIGNRLLDDHSADISNYIKNSISENLNIIELGYKKNISTIIHGFDLFCLPSWREGMPVSAIEAITSGIPVLLTDIRGSRELVDNDLNGLLVDIKSPFQLSNCIEKLYRDRKKLKSFVENNKKNIKKFDIKNIINTQLNILQKDL